MRRGQLLAWGAVLAVAIGLRLALFSGYGLGDDPGFFWCYHRILRSGAISQSCAYDFRFAFWVPVVGLMRLLGVSDATWVGFVTLCSVVNVVLVWLLARQEGFGARGALAAMALMAVFPLEVLCATLFVIDVPLATWCFAAFWLYRAGLREPRRGRALALAAGAAVLLFLGYSTKQWAVLVGLLFAVEALRDPRRTWAVTAVCGAGFLALVGLYFGWQWWRFGDPFFDIRLVRSVAIFLPHSRDILLDYPRMLLLPNEYGSRFAGFYPYALALLALVFVRRTLRAGKWLGCFLVLLAALAAMPSHRDEQGRWVVLVPHIFRYLCFVSIPLCLALGAYVRELLAWRPAAATALLGAFLAISAVQAVRLAGPTRDSFGEQRRALAALRAFPDDRVWSDTDLAYRFLNFELQHTRPDRVGYLSAEDPAARAAQLARIHDGVVVTGGGRLPWYGCHRCTANLAGAPVPDTWRLVTAFEGAPLTTYRAEPLRIWRVSTSAPRAEALLAATPEPAARLALLRDAVARGDAALAREIGERLVAAGEAPAEAAYLTGLAAFRAGHARSAVQHLERALAAGVPAAAARDARTTLALAAARVGDYGLARRAIAGWRAAAPDEALPAELAEIESGLAEGIRAYHETRLGEALAIFQALARREGTDAGAVQRARYFAALTLYRLSRVPAASAASDAYRSAYGEDEAWIELRFRHGEALARTDPRAAAAAWSEVAGRVPGSYWGREARRLLPTLPAPFAGEGPGVVGKHR